MKININLNFPVKGLDESILKGEDGNDSNAGKILGSILVASAKGDALKYYDWGRTLYKGEIIEVDRSDFDAILKFVKSHETLANLTKAQIEIALKDSEKKADEKKSE